MFAKPASPVTRAPGRPLLRRSARMLAWVWLLLALLPLRAWASAEMMVAMAVHHAPAAATHSGNLPPCHLVGDAAPGEVADSDVADSEAGGHAAGAACGCCPFCAWALAVVSDFRHGPVLTAQAPRTAGADAAPSGDPEPFFRPPRG